jgi:putative ABC transport system substrate-binding protein
VIDRRAFLGSLAGGLVVAPLAVRAQPAGTVPRIALIFSSTPLVEMTGPQPTSRLARAFLEGMREVGWVDGQNITIERKSAEGRPERYEGLAQELLRLKLNLIVAAGAGLTRAIIHATTAIPIVMAGAFNDPLAEVGLTSLARPGGNVTGLAAASSNALFGKRLQLLKEAAPTISRVAHLGNTLLPGPTIVAAAHALKLELVPVVIPTPEGLQSGLATIERARVDAFFVADTATFFWLARGALVEFAAKHRLPASYPFDIFVESGGLMSYGMNFSDILRRSATYVDKILKGANPGDLPIEQPTKFELVINLKTARTLGLTIPQALLQRADQVIE